MPCACTVKGMLLKCVKSWLYSCAQEILKSISQVGLRCLNFMLTVRNKHMAGLCMPSLREVPLLISVISQLKYGCKETVLCFFLFIYRRWPHFFRTVCKEEICAEALTDLQCRPNFCSRMSACGSFGFFKCASTVLFSVFVQIYTFLYPSAHFHSLILSLCSLFFVLLKTARFVPLQRFLHCIIFSLITC